MTATSAWVRAFSEASSFWRLLGGGAIVAMLQIHGNELVFNCGVRWVVKPLEFRCAQLFGVENSTWKLFPEL
jgi:hypothetical protein